MLLNQLRNIQQHVRSSLARNKLKYYGSIVTERTQKMSVRVGTQLEPEPLSEDIITETTKGEIFPASRPMPMVLSSKEPIILSFDDVPGPKVLKYISYCRQYISDVGTQITAGLLTLGLNISSYFNTKKPLKNLSTLFDEYGPVVRFVSPVGNDIVLLNNPDHIQKVYSLEGDYPVRSALDSLEKYRAEHRSSVYGGLFNMQGHMWDRQRNMLATPLRNSVTNHWLGMNEMCENLTKRIYHLRNNQDEISVDLYKEIHKWAFDCMGLILFAKKFNMIDTDLVYSQCDMSWLYHCLDKATEAIIKCESGLHFWKILPTPSWSSLVKYCDCLDSLIGKHVLEVEQAILKAKDQPSPFNENSLCNAMLLGEEKMSAEDVSTIIMDMLLIGVNTITSSLTFLTYHIAKYQRAQKLLYKEIKDIETTNISVNDMNKLTQETPYLQACIKETLRLIPPIPVLTRILPKNIVLDRYNIPRGTLIIMSTQDSSLKEGNYDDAAVFYPERWLKEDANEYHAFASIPFGYGARKCLGQNIAETMLSLMTIKMLQKYKLEYHYGDLQPTRTFISKPNKPIKVRFVDRI